MVKTPEFNSNGSALRTALRNLLKPLLERVVLVLLAGLAVCWGLGLQLGGGMLAGLILLILGQVLRDAFALFGAGLFSRKLRARIHIFLLRPLVIIVVFAGLKTVWLWLMAESWSFPLTERDIAARRNHIISLLAAEDAAMPGLIPGIFQKEWLIGSYSMASAALTSSAFRYPALKAQSREAVAEWIKRMLGEDVRAYEEHYWGEDALDSLAGSNGHIGYLGHLNFMFGAYRYLGGDCRFHELQEQVSAALARRIGQSGHYYLETFPGQIFVPDNMVVYASLALWSRISGVDYTEIFKGWREYTAARLLDPRTGLIVPWVDSDGSPLGEARGSYAGWNSFYIPFFDEDFASSQFQKLRQHLLIELPLGFAAVREYPEGVSGSGDIDSGPVVFGLSTSGTGFAVAGAARGGDQRVFQGLLRTAELVGSSWCWNERCSYLMAPLVGEAIMLAMKTAGPWDGAAIEDCTQSLNSSVTIPMLSEQ